MKEPSVERRLLFVKKNGKVLYPSYKTYIDSGVDGYVGLTSGEGTPVIVKASDIHSLVTSKEFVSHLKNNKRQLWSFLKKVWQRETDVKKSLQRFEFVVACFLVTKREKSLKTTNLKMLLLFGDLRKKFSLDEIADALGIHVGTVKRWVSLNDIPTHYFYDFNRLLGKDASSESITGNDAQDKDQYFTKPEVARRCFGKLKEIANALGVNFDGYTFVEPSVGHGDFYKLMPPARRIGIDISPKDSILAYDENIIKQDFLTWTPPTSQKIVVLGNPPFGLRGHTALQFINHAYEFADIVAFILPPLFDSDGKGVPKKRVVEGYMLAHSEKLPPGSFQYPDGREVDVNTIFQVWTKVGRDKVIIKTRKTCQTYIKVYSLSDGGTPSSTRNKKMLDQCDVYLPSTCFDGMKAYKSFAELPNQRGYGVVVRQSESREEILRLLRVDTDWNTVAFKSTNSALNLRSSLIEDVVVNAGFVDKSS